MKAEKKRKAQKKQPLQVRRGVILIVVLALLILIVNIITASFSWFTPVPQSGAGMEYLETTYNRSEQCYFSTLEGHMITASEYRAGSYTVGNQSYSTTGHYVDQIDYFGSALTSVKIGSGETKYFRTSIVNPDELYASDVSLYLSSIGQNANNGAGTPASDLMIACTSPSNTVQFVRGRQDDFAIIRNAFVKVHDENDADGPGLLQVDWFVYNKGTTSITIDLTASDPENPTLVPNPNMYLMYN